MARHRRNVEKSRALESVRAGLDRRQFLLGGAAAGAACFLGWPLLPSSRTLAFAQNSAGSPPTAPDLFFLVLRTEGNGGMDATLGLDPWTAPQRPKASDLFLEYAESEITQAGGLSLGPAAAALAPHASDIAVINGVLVGENDNGHQAPMTYMSTGDGSGKAPDLIVELAVAAGAGPYGAMASEGMSAAGRKINRSRLGDVALALTSEDPATALAKLISDSRQTPLEKAQGSVVDAQPITSHLLQTLSDWKQAGTPIDDERVAAAAFLSGAASQAQISMRPSVNLDTHAGHVGNHIKGQKSIWERTAAIFAFFKSIPFGQSGESLFDRTTFYVYSEFSRTPALDAAGGKNHNPLLNSALLAGRGLRGGQAIGASLLIEAARSAHGASYHMAAPFDWTTGKPAAAREGASFIFPEHVIQSCARIYGADPALFRSVDGKTNVIPGLIKA